MNSTLATWLLLLVALVAANAPFVSNRILLVGPHRGDKRFVWRLLELLLVGALTVMLGRTLEWRLGQIEPQGWEFYATVACLFLTFAFPGFVWRYLHRGS